MPKWLKIVVGISLLPVCLGSIRTLLRVIEASGQAGSFWVSLLGGLACWLAVFLLLPRPMLIYVFGHELTHALWTWLFGGRVKKFRVTAKGGHVIISKSNFLIALAPYFFPLYVVLVVLVFFAGHLLWDWSGYVAWFHWLIGAAYGFHITLTWHILKTTQSDITGQGTFFSWIVIFLGNMTVLLLGLPLLTSRVSALTALGWWLQESGGVILRLRDWLIV